MTVGQLKAILANAPDEVEMMLRIKGVTTKDYAITMYRPIDRAGMVTVAALGEVMADLAFIINAEIKHPIQHPSM